MTLPKTLTPSLIKKLNEACEFFRNPTSGAECDCDEVGWCDACWLIASGESLLFDEVSEEEDGII